MLIASVSMRADSTKEWTDLVEITPYKKRVQEKIIESKASLLVDLALSVHLHDIRSRALETRAGRRNEQQAMQALSSDILAYDDRSSKDKRVAVIGHDGIYISRLFHVPQALPLLRQRPRQYEIT